MPKKLEQRLKMFKTNRQVYNKRINSNLSNFLDLVMVIRKYIGVIIQTECYMKVKIEMENVSF